jgi:hypothetical protein
MFAYAVGKRAKKRQFEVLANACIGLLERLYDNPKKRLVENLECSEKNITSVQLLKFSFLQQVSEV